MKNAREIILRSSYSILEDMYIVRRKTVLIIYNLDKALLLYFTYKLRKMSLPGGW